MHTLIAFSASIDSASPIAVAALADQHVRVSGNDIIVPAELNALIGAFAFGVSLTRAQLVSPSLRRIINQELAPINIAALPVSPTAWIDQLRNPIVLDPQEALNVFAAENAVGASRVNAGIWLGDGVIEPVSGDIRTVRVTGATALVANAWTNGGLTFDQSLPAGRYQVVGARFESANLQLARLVFVGGTWRPGCIGYAAASAVEHDAFRGGNMGVWGEFEHNTPPTVDFLANAADAAQAGELDLIKIA